MTTFDSAHFVRLLTLGLVLFVMGCAGTTVGPVAIQAPRIALRPPRTIAVIVDNESPAPEKLSRRERQLADAQATSAALYDVLSKLLVSRRLSAVPEGHPSDLVLRCRILDVRGGSKVLRLLVGYGAGKAMLHVEVSLTDPTNKGGAPLLSFETQSTSGSMPGRGFSAPALVGTALKSLKEDGLSQEIGETTREIDAQLNTYFLEQRWPYAVAD